MENQELMQYMKSAIEVETDLAKQEQMLNRCCADIQQRKPTLQLESIPQAPKSEKDSPALGYFCIAAGVALFFILGSITGFDEWIGGPLVFGAAFAIPGLLIIMSVEKGNAKVQQEHDTYHQHVAQIRTRNNRMQQDYEDAIRQCDDSDRALRAAAKPYITATKDVLEKLYDKDFIYPKYRTLPALTSIYEYFMTGRCTELTGPHGAYNLYEDELRKDTVISQLNTVIENLEQIRHNQYMLYQQVKAIQENTAVIASELKQIKGYTIQIAQLTALNAYYAALTERNTRITMYYHL